MGRRNQKHRKVTEEHTQTDKQTYIDRQTDRQVDGHTDRQTDRHIKLKDETKTYQSSL